MSPLHQAVEDNYLAVRRALGFKLEDHGRLLPGFVDCLEQTGASTVTVEAALAWAVQPQGCQPYRWSQRLSVVRGFARYLHVLDPTAQVPPADLLAYRRRRPTPYLYSQAEITALLAAAGTLTHPLRATTHRTVFGLLAATGMRCGEALRLDRDDIDCDAGLLAIRQTKFNKCRLLPLHPSTVVALRGYALDRDRLCVQCKEPSFFVSTTGTRLAGPARAGGVRHAGRARRVTAPLRVASPAHSRSEAQLRRGDPARLVPRRRRRGRQDAAAVGLPRPHQPRIDLLVSAGRPRAADPGRRTPRPTRGAAAMSALAPTIEAFFTDRLTTQRDASPRTVAAYRDAWRLLLAYVHDRTGKAPSQLDVADIDAALVAAFLTHLEAERGNSVATRNARLSAIRSLFGYAALRHPEHAELIQRVLAIPAKRFDQADVCFLAPDEIDALLVAPDRASWTGRRDHALLLLDVQTGLRVAELTGLVRDDVHLHVGAHVRCHGKGRKDRATPLTAQTVPVLRVWLRERAGDPHEPLFPTRRGGPLSSDAVEWLVAKHAAAAAVRCPSLAGKHVTPHVLRHTAAMQLLQAGVDVSVIALWMGHESVQTTSVYLHADLALKEQALARTAPPTPRPAATVPPDPLLAFLEAL